MTSQELAALIDNQFSAHVFDYSFTAKDSLLEALWPVLAQAWEEGYEAGLQDGDYVSTGNAKVAVNPYSEVSA